MMKSMSSSKRRERTPDDCKSKRVKVSKSSEKEKIRKYPVDSKTKHADVASKSSREKEKIRKKSDDSKSRHSKSSEKVKVREKPDDSKSKHSKTPAKSDEREKVRETIKSVPRKTRWQAEDKKDSPKEAPTSQPAAKKEKSRPPPRIRDSIHDKAKIVDLLFQTVTGTALQELIPDYLKKRSIDELKKLCVEQIKLMSDESILQILSRKVDSSNKEEKVVEKKKILKPEQPNLPKEKEKQGVSQGSEKKSEESKRDATDKPPGDASQPPATSSEELEIVYEQSLPVVIKEEMTKDLVQSNRDTELLELEMRARAIRSLLKVKSQSPNEGESSKKEDN